MKILELSFSLSSGGGERFVVDLSNRLAENPNNEVILLTTDDADNPKNIHYLGDVASNVRFINLHCPSGFSIKAFWRVFKAIQKEKPDIVHAHCNLLLLFLPALLLHGPKYVHTLHSLAKVCLHRPWMKELYHWYYQHCVQAITISKSCKQSFCDCYGEGNVINITNGREPMIPAEKIPDDVVFLAKSNIPVFIHVARCAAIKNQPRLFKAFDRLQSEGYNFHLIVLGSGYEKEWMPKYLGNPQIHIIGERKNVADYMALADFFVLSSDFEGLPLTLLEAMSLGVVPISTPAGGVVDVLKNGRNGYVSSSFNDDDYYQVVKKALTDNGAISKDVIKQDYENHYSMKICAQKYYDVYQNILKK